MIDWLIWLGVFANGHMNMEHARNKTPDGMPSLEDMTLAAVKVLQKNKNGFLLVVGYFSL